MNYEKYKERMRVYSAARRRKEAGGVAKLPSWVTKRPERKKVNCIVCGESLTVMNNYNFHKTPICNSESCKRFRKTQLQRERRLRGGK